MSDILPIGAVTRTAGLSGSAQTSDVNAVNDSFKNILSDAIDKVSETQAKADDAIQKLSTGDVDNVHQVMIALEEANIVLQFTMQLRNKVVDAYQEIMRMQV